jgi:two-component system, OmpR family, phosphate regulon sensor histidine kinase PhoR
MSAECLRFVFAAVSGPWARYAMIRRMRLMHRWPRVDPVLIVTFALLSATVLVIYLQRGAFAALEEQSVDIREKILEQTAQQIALEIRSAIEEPAYDTLRPLRRDELLAGGVPRVLRTYAKAIDKYPLIDRFFLWSDDTERQTPGEVLFFSGEPNPALARDPELGARIYQGLRMASVARRNYAALQNRVGDCTYDVLAHYYWIEPRRDRYTFLVGYVICAERAGPRLLHALYGRNRAEWLNRADGEDAIELRVFDERRRLIFGSPPTASGIVGRASLRAQFYPDRLSSVAVTAPPREWTIQVSSSSPAPAAMRTQGAWLLGFSVLLILVALAVAVRGQKRASELARMQTDFVSHVSHQLRTPLSLVTAVAETLALNRVKSPEKSAQYLDIVRTETARLSILVERILEFSRVAGGARVYQLESVDLTALVRETAAAFAQTPAATAFRIRVEDGGNACVVRADPVALEQALVNLLDNAVKYSDQSREVTVRVRCTASDAAVEIEDHGIGIASAEHGRIFERFYRGSSAVTQRGFGLGLAIVKEIVRAHRGHIEVESSPGRETLFRIRLPLQKVRGFRALVNLRAIRASRSPDVIRSA